MAASESAQEFVFACGCAFDRQGLRSQIVTLNGKRGEHLKYMPYAFTENGVAMLSGILRSSTGELHENMVVSKMETTTLHGALAGKTQTHSVNCYNLWAGSALPLLSSMRGRSRA